ncbi:MAG: formyltetrahydrofolate deformylase [Chlamydiota bacterium]|jgi:formyltetrahydrofolate deformylase
MNINKFVFTLSCEDQIGIIAKTSNIIAEVGGFILELSQYGDPETHQFFMRCLFELDHNKINFLREKLEQVLGKKFMISSYDEPMKTVIMVSKQGHCLNHLLHQIHAEKLPIDIQMIVSNHLDLKHMADNYQIPFLHLPVDKTNKLQQEEYLLQKIKESNTELVILARYMQILSPHLTKCLAGKIINIHHSFLPCFKGAKPYHQAYERGVKLIGATAHYVTDELDEGPIIEQEVARVDHSDSPKQMVQIGSEVESRVLYRAVKYHIEKRVFTNGIKTVVFK